MQHIYCTNAGTTTQEQKTEQTAWQRMNRENGLNTQGMITNRTQVSEIWHKVINKGGKHRKWTRRTRFKIKSKLNRKSQNTESWQDWQNDLVVHYYSGWMMICVDIFINMLQKHFCLKQFPSKTHWFLHIIIIHCQRFGPVLTFSTFWPQQVNRKGNFNCRYKLSVKRRPLSGLWFSFFVK